MDGACTDDDQYADQREAGDGDEMHMNTIFEYACPYANYHADTYADNLNLLLKKDDDGVIRQLTMNMHMRIMRMRITTLTYIYIYICQYL